MEATGGGQRGRHDRIMLTIPPEIVAEADDQQLTMHVQVAAVH